MEESIFGRDIISISDDEGNEFELELLDVLEHKGVLYNAFALADDLDDIENGDDDDALGIIVLKTVEDNGEEFLATVDDLALAEEVFSMFEMRFREESE